MSEEYRQDPSRMTPKTLCGDSLAGHGSDLYHTWLDDVTNSRRPYLDRYEGHRAIATGRYDGKLCKFMCPPSPRVFFSRLDM
jgi:hypothetical protein